MRQALLPVTVLFTGFSMREALGRIKSIKSLKILRSIRLRIFLCVFILGILPCIFMRYFILSSYESRIVSVRTGQVQALLHVVSDRLISTDYLRSPANPEMSGELTEFANQIGGRIMVVGPDLKVLADTYKKSEGSLVVSGDVVRCLRQGNRAATSRYDREDNFIELFMPVGGVSDGSDAQAVPFGLGRSGRQMDGVIMASVSTNEIETTLELLRRRTLLLEIILILVLFFIAVFVASILLEPFERLTGAIRDVQAGFTTDDIDVGSYTETEHIGDAFNQVLGRMRTMDESRQEFVSNVSHELKTPMTSMKVLADSLLQQGDMVPPEMYREFLQDIDDELDRENKMISELLSLAKMDRRQVSMNVTDVNINELAEIVMRRVRPLARQKDIELTMVSEREITAQVDEIKMTMVFTNLIENAVKYNREHGSVHVTLNSDHRNFTFTVEDTGVGIPQESLDRIFDRFYRVDKSRSREIGGTGLGLSITRSAVLLHKGTIEVESEEGVGTRFIVTIPLRKQSEG